MLCNQTLNLDELLSRKAATTLQAYRRAPKLRYKIISLHMDVRRFVMITCG